MHLLVDVQGLQNGSRFRGIGRYTKSLVKSLVQTCAPNDKVTLLVNGALGVDEALIKEDFSEILEKVSVITWFPLSPCDWARPSNHIRRNVSELLREFMIDSVSPDVLLISSLVEGCGDNVVTSIKLINKIPTAVIFYDLIPLIYPDEYLTNTTLQNWYGEKLNYLKKADLLLAISESSRSEAIDRLSTLKGQVVNISSGFDPELFKISCREEQSIPSKYGINESYLLYVGAGDPRKNLDQLVAAFASIKDDLRKSVCLVLVGDLSHGQIKELKLIAKRNRLPLQRLIFTGRVSDEEMQILYQNALAFVFPSLHEGFGLPLLEAMAAGIPVIASNCSAFPEVLGEEDGLFDPASRESITKVLTKIIQSENFRNHLLKQQSTRLEMFPWSSVAEKAWASLRNVRKSQSGSGSVSGFNREFLFRLLAEKLVEVGASADDYVETAVTVEKNLAVLGSLE